MSFRLEKEVSGGGGRDKSSRREKPPPITAAIEDTSSEKVDSNTSDPSDVAAAVTPTDAASAVVTSTDAASADAVDADEGCEVAALSSLHEAGMAAAVIEVQVQDCVEEDDGSPSLITWQARDAAAVARQPHPCPLPQALFAPDILLPPQQAAALAGGAAPPKRLPSKPFLAFMEGLSALQCVSQSGVVSLDIERIFPLGPCNDSLR